MLKRVDIDQHWEKILPAAQRLLTDPDEARPDHLLEACRLGQAVCLQNDDGYIITRIGINAKTGQREYVLWFANSITDEAGAFERALPELRRAAETMGCANLVFYSTRKGWIKKSAAAGWRLRNAEFVMRVERSH